VRNKIALIYEYIVNNDFDVIAITESWLNGNDDVILSQLIPAGYTSVKRNQQNGQSGGGILLINKILLKFNDY